MSGLTSLIGEDLRSIPKPALRAALDRAAAQPEQAARAYLDASLAALAAGEPKRALLLLARSPHPPRIAAAVTAWARQLDRNWYPGGVGAEVGLDTADAFVRPQPGEPLTELLEQVVNNGPTGLITPRTLLEFSVRTGQAQGVNDALGDAWRKLEGLAGLAQRHSLAPVGLWTMLAWADLSRRADLPQTGDLLAGARQQIVAAGDGGLLALSHLIEGDWYAAPGNSPESLGWDLAPQHSPTRLPPGDLDRAAAGYAQAESALGRLDLPRLRGALALRHAALARGHDPDVRRRHLAAAAEAYLIAGDGAGSQLVVAHQLVADIDEGRLGQLALDLGAGWTRPVHGPVADLLGWAEGAGSTSWCVGLGRLLERCAESWRARGSNARARIAYLAALWLISLAPEVPAHTLVTAIAYADSRSNLSTQALLRLERTFGPLLADTTVTEPFAFTQKLEAAQVYLGALRDRARGPAADQAADRMAQLRSQLAAAVDTMTAAVPAIDVPIPRSMAELAAARDAMLGDGSLEAQAQAANRAVGLMLHMQLQGARETMATLAVLAPLTHAEHAQRLGLVADAEGWFAQAVDAARLPGVPSYLLPLVLLATQRRDEAQVELGRAEQAGTLPDEFLAMLALRAHDHRRAAAAIARRDAVLPASTAWSDQLVRAEVFLGVGDVDAGRAAAGAAIVAFEDSARLLLRDPERLAACDRPDVAAMYATLAKCHPDDPEASLVIAELARSLSYDTTGTVAEHGVWRAWQRSAAEYAARANRLLASLPASPPERQQEGFAALDLAESALSDIERRLDAADPGVLLRRSTRGAQPTAADLRRRLPEGTLLLEYLAVGDDLLGWAVTRDGVRSDRQQLPTRELAAMVRDFHRSCAEGRSRETHLAALLLAPHADLLRACDRVVVVPFGPLTMVPFHALRFDDAPLGLSHVVSYAPRAAHLAEDRPPDSPVTLRRSLVVGDPAFETAAHPTLVELPGARVEAVAVGAALGTPADDVLVGAAATEAAVGARLEDCDVLHLSTHGRLDELAPFASSLVLAGRDELTVADIAGLRFGTDLAVLSGCDTGRGAATLGGDLIGLTRSLLRSGVRRTVVSLWPVDDDVAPVLMQAFYTSLAAGRPCAHALADAQRQVAGMTRADLRAAYEALGGTPEGYGAAGRRGARRGPVGLELDAELRDDEEVPEPLGGDAERYWAPFVLVG